MNARRSTPLICSLLAVFVAPLAFAGSHGHPSAPGPALSRPAANPVGRISAGTGRHWNSGNVPHNFNNFNRNGVRWNGNHVTRPGNFSRTGNLRRAGNGNVRWNANRTNHWNHHHCGNRFVYVGGFGYPWYFPDYYYPYGPYTEAYPYYSNVSYGQPVYEGNSSYNAEPSDSGATADSNGSVIVDVQRLLAREGFYQGAIDGALGSRTYYAIRAYQRSHKMRVDGQVSPQLLNTMGLR